MITLEQKLKIQAYLDGELSQSEAKKVEFLIASDNEAKQIFEELKCATDLLQNNEPEIKMPISRELFWNRIYNEIQKSEDESISVFDYIRHLKYLLLNTKYLVPVAAAIIALVSIFLIKDIAQPIEDYLVSIETTSEEVGSYSFRVQSENMFVVWIYNKDSSDGKNIESDLISEEELMMQ